MSGGAERVVDSDNHDPFRCEIQKSGSFDEKTSKRLRKLEDNIEDIISGLAIMRELISAQNAPASLPPETIAPNLEDADNRVNESEDTNVKDPEVSKDTEDSTAQVTPVNETVIQNENTPGSGNSHKAVAKESSISEEVEVPWELDADGLRIFGEDPVLKEPELVLHSSVTTRWKKYLSDGLTKEENNNCSSSSNSSKKTTDFQETIGLPEIEPISAATSALPESLVTKHN
ncbi:hypothetical protein KQX54_009796, partial [Cotesia glomerata]